MIWLTGHTHAGTTLLLSLLDGLPDCLVYPNEPFFLNLFNRTRSFSVPEIKRYFLIDSRNVLHCRDERAIVMKAAAENTFPAPDALGAALTEVARRKRIAALPPASFPHETFFKSYFSSLTRDLDRIRAADRRQFVDAAFAALQAGVDAAVPGLKTGSVRAFKDPIGRFRPGELDWFLNAWPEGKIVFLQREPHARVWSHIQHDLKNGRAYVRLANDRSTFKGLSKSYARDRVYASLLPESNRILKINYEDLVTDTRRTMQRVCTFLDIDFAESATRCSYLGFEASPSTNRTGSNTVNGSSLYKWRDNLTGRERFWISYYLLRARVRSLAGGRAGQPPVALQPSRTA